MGTPPFACPTPPSYHQPLLAHQLGDRLGLQALDDGQVVGHPHAFGSPPERGPIAVLSAEKDTLLGVDNDGKHNGVAVGRVGGLRCGDGDRPADLPEGKREPSAADDDVVHTHLAHLAHSAGAPWTPLDTADGWVRRIDSGKLADVIDSIVAPDDLATEHIERMMRAADAILAALPELTGGVA